MLSLLDRLWRPDLSQEEALELMRKGVEEVGAGWVSACMRAWGWGVGEEERGRSAGHWARRSASGTDRSQGVAGRIGEGSG